MSRARSNWLSGKVGYVIKSLFVAEAAEQIRHMTSLRQLCSRVHPDKLGAFLGVELNQFLKVNSFSGEETVPES